MMQPEPREGIVGWNQGKAYLVEQGHDGCCTHLDRCGRGCTIHENRPVPYWALNCRNDRRIWLDFEERIHAPALDQPDRPYCLQGEHGGAGSP